MILFIDELKLYKRLEEDQLVTKYFLFYLTSVHLFCSTPTYFSVSNLLLGLIRKTDITPNVILIKLQ